MKLLVIMRKVNVELLNLTSYLYVSVYLFVNDALVYLTHRTKRDLACPRRLPCILT